MKNPSRSLLPLLAVALLSTEALAEDALPEPLQPVFVAGDIQRGETLFQAQRCNRCHSVTGAAFAEEDLPSRPRVHLGDERHEGWTRDDFARAIMAPSHSMNPDYERMMRQVGDQKGAASSPMPQALDTLTVRQLSDIVTFLETSSSAQ